MMIKVEARRLAVAAGAILAAGGLLLAGCTSGDQPGPATTSHTVSMTTTTTELPSTTPIPSSNPEDLVGWVGQYSFAEIISPVGEPPTATLSYGISIYQMGTGFFAAMSVVGYGATQSMMTTVEGDATTVTLYFNSFIGANPWKKSYNPGDALVTLSVDDKGKVITTWGTMKPAMPENATPTTMFTLVTPSASSTKTPTSTKTS